MPVSSAKLPELDEARISPSNGNAYKSHKNGRNILISSPQSGIFRRKKCGCILRQPTTNNERVRTDRYRMGGSSLMLMTTGTLPAAIVIEGAYHLRPRSYFSHPFPERISTDFPAEDGVEMLLSSHTATRSVVGAMLGMAVVTIIWKSSTCSICIKLTGKFFRNKFSN